VYALKGPGGEDVYKSALNGLNGVFMDAQNSCKIVETKSFELPGQAREIYDPLFRNVSVGEYNVMIDTVSKYLPPDRQYVSAMRDIFVFNEDRDNFSRISIKAALDNCNRFAYTGDLWWPSLDFPRDPDVSDMFVTEDSNGNSAPVIFFGDMDEQYLSFETIKLVAQSVVKARAAAGAAAVPINDYFPGTIAAAGGVAGRNNQALVYGKPELYKLLSAALGLDDQDQLFNDRAETFAASFAAGLPYDPTGVDPGANGVACNFIRFIVTYGFFIKNQDNFDTSVVPYEEQYVYAVNLITLGLAFWTTGGVLAGQRVGPTAGRQICEILRGNLPYPGLTPKRTVIFTETFPPAGALEPRVAGSPHEKAEASVKEAVEDLLKAHVSGPIPPFAGNPGAPVYAFGAGYFDQEDQEEEMGAPPSKQLFGAARQQGISTDPAGSKTIKAAVNGRSEMYTKKPDAPRNRPSKALDQILAKVDAITSSDLKDAALAFIGTPVTKKALETLLEKDIIFPFSFLLLRPYITHR